METLQTSSSVQARWIPRDAWREWRRRMKEIDVLRREGAHEADLRFQRRELDAFVCAQPWGPYLVAVRDTKHRAAPLPP